MAIIFLSPSIDLMGIESFVPKIFSLMYWSNVNLIKSSVIFLIIVRPDVDEKPATREAGSE